MEAVPAAASIDVRVEPIGRGPLRALVVARATTAFVLTASRPSPRLIPTSRLVVARRATGEVLASGSPAPRVRMELLQRMQEALTTMPEEAFVERWCDPRAWTALVRD